jgi:hypothetical protein
MADDLKQTGKHRLREAVAKAGPMVKNVERELRG